MKIIVFGAGLFGKQYIGNLKNEEIVAVCDNNWEFMNSCDLCGGGGGMLGHKIISPEKIPEMEFDYVVIAIDCRTEIGQNSIFEILHQLKELGISEQKILHCNVDGDENEYIGRTFKHPRVQFLYDFAKLVYEKNIDGSVAECGVSYGMYSYHINRAFPDRKLYLFDTFEGFSEHDLKFEDTKIKNHITLKTTHIVAKNEKNALLKCQFRDNIIIKKGYIPNTFDGLPEDKFIFVNLDMDIYAPTIAALNFFALRMSKGGVIAVHDYCDGYWLGCRKAVNEFCNDNSNKITPIGDGCTLLILF
jgi:hypothetical protein